MYKKLENAKVSINFKYIAKNETRVVLSILVLDDTNTSARKISK